MKEIQNKKRKFLYHLGEGLLKGTDKKTAQRETLYRRISLVAVSLLGVVVFLAAGTKLVRADRFQDQPGRRAVEYQKQLEDRKLLNEQLQSENNQLNQRFLEERSNAFVRFTEDQPESRALAEEYRIASVMAGLTPYEGDGIRVVMQDKEGIRYDSTTSASEIIHDGDIRYIVDWFKSQYAAAIAVNGERLSPMSPLLCTGPSVLVNRVYQSSPFVVEAGIDSAVFLPMLLESEGVKQMEERGIRLTITAESELEIKSQRDIVFVNEQVKKLGGSS